MSKFDGRFSGMNLRKALRLAYDLGCVIYHARRTGEMVIFHPLIAYRVRFNCRRTDSPRALSVFLKHVARLTA